jgi:uncharacterized protein YicC (UPF0701 family)
MRSMTGFGRASGEVSGRRCVIEVRSVNHRFLDLKLRLSPGFADPIIEQLLTQGVRRRVERGSLVVSVREEVAGAGIVRGAPALHLDAELARAYGDALSALGQTLAASLGLAPGAWPPSTAEHLTPLVAFVAAQPGVIGLGEAGIDAEASFQQMEPLLEQAIAEMQKSRQREGAALARDLLGRLQLLTRLVTEVKDLTDAAPEAARRRLEDRLARLLEGGTPMDAQRLAQEVALLADRLDVSEEITRLRAHLLEFERLCQAETLAGRRLDFLTQEINREVNTISAKSQSGEVAARVVAMKAELERLREQIQNVE